MVQYHSDIFLRVAPWVCSAIISVICSLRTANTDIMPVLTSLPSLSHLYMLPLVPISLIYCCVTNHPKLGTTMIILLVNMKLGWGLAVTAHFCSRGEVNWGGRAGPGPSIHFQDSIPTLLQVVAGCHMGLSPGLPHGGWVPREVVEVAGLLGPVPRS